MKVLAFDTSSKALSVAILDGKNLLADVTVNIKKNHSITLMPAIDFLMTSVDLQPSDLDRIVVAQGPGSYTGLRVAVATAKTLAYTLNIELVGVSSLYALAAAADLDGLVVPIMDARRNNVYAGFYKNGQSVKADQHMSFTAVLKAVKAEAKVMFVGEVDNFRDQIEEALPQAVILPVLPSAYAIGNYGQSLEPADVDSFVPNYLKRVEAEENWLKTHKEDSTADYVKRI
ncbi:tRNA (adenosine(37)-N6)-threonylcarbamoyltransferase complex dimerization subunit type 1 TsaB [Streptococcus gallolyticus subsp. gallolyticus]|uniref:tRNA (adenosine(37)-N6)-threonylcarbamoyltransferase complex dimerization subunit type 1 TsaB n=1 Tax=Streptococcus gallolyticus TaxID=315405 RepID=UPI0005C6DA06|nr:tRNA (adenosine(37)-N6)-threonylcarbamoyltransferase complex dimerization subunit type 1 TsaB [Streptococcus gallolyticus]MCF2565033.1 tRNA (adenosine(37)-N6)-threonylcarbamoyltransferase complex dimerization subunit type 1 TsaB [Streptococcus pasteurianus]MCL4888898.1 tRNA (adenosine(37)-N6)-threonylcarbamoyltransferase complex dimerization subunit type 1 TsaB [Streptococcus gallolyticus]MCY7156807.1 tRNA (adenosine(37)-N6)-threonylcarbamoyltransferase complex dimerization subunit type 1 Tsa